MARRWLGDASASENAGPISSRTVGGTAMQSDPSTPSARTPPGRPVECQRATLGSGMSSYRRSVGE
eukprot:1099598-Pyramimonas_sp.AAC.1